MKRTRRASARQGIQSIEVGHRLLQALSAAPQPMMLRDLAKAAHMPASKAHRYLVSFARIGLVEQEAVSGRYELGAFALELGLAALGRLDAVSVAMPFLRELATQLSLTAAIAVWANHGATIVRWVGADSPVSATLRVGSVLPLTRSATGLSFLAFAAEQRSRVLLQKELSLRTEEGRSSARAQLQKRLEQTRDLGYASVSDFIPGISGMAAPVYDAEHNMVLALVVLGYSAAFDPLAKSVGAQLLKASQQLSLRLGAR